MSFPAALLVTLAVEVPLYAAALAALRFATAARAALIGAAVNLLTHPLLWFVFPRIHPFALFVVAGESAVIATEAMILAALGVRRPVLVSFAANLTSAVLGWFALEFFQ